MTTRYLNKHGIGTQSLSYFAFRRPRKIIYNYKENTINNTISLYGLKNSKILNFLSNYYKNIMKSVKIINNTRGCNLCEIEFLKPFEFDIEPMTKISITINGERFFFGYIDFIEDDYMNENDIIKYKFKGLVEQLKRTRYELSYPTNTRITYIIDDIIKNYVSKDTDILYNPAKIDKITNTTQIAAILQTSKSNTYELFEKLCKVINYDWGVDEYGEFFAVPNSNAIYDVFFENYKEITIKKNFKDIRNIITIKRQSTTGTGETGWTIAAQLLDNTSIQKYGKNFYDLQVPGYFDDISCGIIANNILNEFKEPKEEAIIKEYPLKKIKFIPCNKIYKIIKKVKWDYRLIDDFDDLSKITFNSSDTSANEQITTNDFISGYGALRIYNIASTSTKIYKLLNLNIKGYVIKFYIFAKLKNINNSSHTNYKVKIYYGENSYFENEIDLYIETKFYQLYVIELDNPMRKINEIAIQLNDNKSDIELYFDKMYCMNYNYKHLENKLTKIEYFIASDTMYANLEFNYRPEKFENFVNGLLSEVEMLKYVSERR